MRYCENCQFLFTEGYEYPESYCGAGISEDDDKFFEDSKGCGCKYNLRTLKKFHEAREHDFYLSMLGYIDYSFMPTMEYTEENKKILEHYLDLCRHAIGMDNNKIYTRHNKRFFRPYRNFFATTEHTVDYPYWEKLVINGIAEKKVRKYGIVYCVTRYGMDWIGEHDKVYIYDMR